MGNALRVKWQTVTIVKMEYHLLSFLFPALLPDASNGLTNGPTHSVVLRRVVAVAVDMAVAVAVAAAVAVGPRLLL